MPRKKINEVDIEFPPKFYPFMEPKRFKCVYGGRGGAKSWSLARLLLIMGTQKPLRILCCREVMVSIADSIHQLLSDQIHLMGLDSFYEIEKTTIRGKNNPNPDLCTTFRFQGIKTNIAQIRSYEGIDICFVEEAANVSNHSWETLIPTIRGSIKNGRPMDSEIWVAFNPVHSTDSTYRRFVMNPPVGRSLVVQMNYDDNPWFPDVLQEEMEDLKLNDYDAYCHVWLGQCKKAVDGAVYGREISKAEEDGHLCEVRYDPKFPVEAFWDIGWADATSIFLAQKVGFETHIINHYENSRQPLDFYLNVLSRMPYAVDKHWLPHDARAKQLGTGQSIEEMMRSKGKVVQIVPKFSKVDQINCVRSVFPSLWFDLDNCEDALNLLRQYRYEVQPNLIDGAIRFKNAPEHDHSSHCADALAYLCVALRPPKVRPKFQNNPWETNRNTQNSWMSSF